MGPSTQFVYSTGIEENFAIEILVKLEFCKEMRWTSYPLRLWFWKTFL